MQTSRHSIQFNKDLLKTDGALGHTVPLEGRIRAWSGASEPRFGIGSGGPLPSRSAQGAIHIPVPPQVAHSPRQAPRFLWEAAEAETRPGWEAPERHGAQRHQSCPAGEPVQSLEGQLPEGALLSTDGHSAARAGILTHACGI